MLALLSIFSYVLICALLAALAWRDAKDYLLPDTLNAALALSFMAFHISTGWEYLSPPDALLGGLAGGGFLYLIRLFATRFYHEDALGLGDVKLMAAAGLGLGFPSIFMALSIGAFAGMFHGLGMALYQRLTTKHKVRIGHVNVPAGVGLAIGIAAVVFYDYGFEWLNTLPK